MTTYNLADGGYVTVTQDPHTDQQVIQKYDAQGNAVGSGTSYSGAPPSEFAALSDGGFVVATSTWDELFSTNGNMIAANTLNGTHIAASPDGGFLLEGMQQSYHGYVSPITGLILYTNTGSQVASGALFGAPVPVSVDSQGDYVLTSNASGSSTTLTIDPTHPALDGPAAPSLISVYDDAGPTQGYITNGSSTDDTALTFRVAVSQVGAVAAESVGFLGGSQQVQVATVSAQDVANGYVDVTAPLSANQSYAIQFQSVDSQDLAGPSGGYVFNWNESGFSSTIGGVSQGGQAVSSGQTVASSAADVTINLGGGVSAGDTVTLKVNGSACDQQTVTAAEVGHQVVFHEQLLPSGSDSLVSEVSNPGGQVSDSGAFQLNVQPASGLSITGPDPTPEGNSGSTDFAFTVTRTGDLSGAAAVGYYMAYSPQVDSADFAGPTNDTIYFNPGDATQLIHVAVAGDTTVEGDESFILRLNDARGASIVHGTASATILNDDTASSGGSPGVISITGPGSETAGTSGTTDFAFHVTRTGDLSQGAAVDYYQAYGGSADSSDFAGPTAGTAYFQAGQSDAVIHIAVAGDPNPEPDESFTIALSNARGGTIDQNAGEASATIVSGASSGGSSSVSTSDAEYTAPSGVHTITLTGTSSQTIHGNNEGDTFWSNNNANTLIGGTGDDTFHLGHNGDVATGGGGNDTFAFAENPWSTSGRITDFNAGDVIDLTETLHRAGYSSGDPIAEGYVKFASDSSGNAQVWFDPDPSHSATFWLVTGLDGVDAASLHANAGLITL